MSVSEVIKKAAREKGVALTKIAKAIGMTNAGFYRMLEGTTLKVETLQKIAEFLEIPIVVFFGQDAATASNTEALEKENAMLLELNRVYKILLEKYERQDIDAINTISTVSHVSDCLRNKMFDNLNDRDKENVLDFFRVNHNIWEKETRRIYDKHAYRTNEKKMFEDLAKSLSNIITDKGVLKTNQ